MSLTEVPRGPYVVVDASVALKWSLDDEESVAEATALLHDALRGKFTMLAPSLWIYEITNGLTTAMRRRRITAAAGEHALENLLALGVFIADPEPRSVLAQASSLGLSAYDAAYVALAETLLAQLWTGDRRLCASAAASSGSVRWIGDYSIG